MDGLAAEVRRPPVQRRTLGVRVTVGSGANDATGHLPGRAALLLMDLLPGGGMRHPFDRAVMVGDDRPLGADAQVDAAAPVRLGRAAGLLGDDRLYRHDQPAAALAQGHRQDARPALDDQPLQPSGVLLGSELADHRHGEMAAIWFQAHRAGGEAHPVTIPMAGLEPWEADLRALAAARLGVRPVVEPHYQVGDPRRIGFLGGAAPPGRHFVLDLVPRLAKLVEVPGQRRDRRIGGAGFEVAFTWPSAQL
jgi:hypothetical protein